MSQLATFLCETISLEDLRLIKSLSPSRSPSNAEELLEFSSENYDEDTEGFIIIISGVDVETFEPCTFGCYTYKPWVDRIRIEEREAERWERCVLFQTSPFQDVFRGNVGKTAWEASNGKLQFGSPSMGVGLKLTDGLKRAQLTHIPGDSAQSVFRATGSRGMFAITVNVKDIEVWG